MTDILQMIANGLTTVATPELMDFLLKYVEKEPVERIIVGHPKQMNNEDSENMKRIVPFVNQLKKKLPQIPVEMVDERFTSVLAHQAMLAHIKEHRMEKAAALLPQPGQVKALCTSRCYIPYTVTLPC